MKIQFLGAARTVTGSKYLLTIDDHRYLVDCGLFQGNHTIRRRNWDELPVGSATIDYVLLTHAHIDHSGYLPLLVKNGFKGKILTTAATFDLCKVLLPDCGHLQEEEAASANKYHSSKHEPALPLYTVEEAYKTLSFFEVIPFNKPVQLSKHFKVTWHPAGHILGAAFLELLVHGQKLLFSGDLGRDHDPIMHAPQTPPDNINYMVVESTYGDRQHKDEDPQQKLAEIINEVVAEDGVVVIPAFAVGRVQSILYHLYMLRKHGKIPAVPIYLDSPMGINATDLMCRYHHEHRLSRDTCSAICGIVEYTRTAEESKAINSTSGSKIIISASGMVSGGRVLHHVRYYAPDARNAILLTGFQAPGTRGHIIESGHGTVKIFNDLVPVRAKVISLSNMSAHVDYTEMLQWLSLTDSNPKTVFITHGELKAAESLKRLIEQEFGWSCVIPEYLSEYEL
ncbi:MAG: MBL fold metallo-hydrolase RNA specificity domain-containing protein [Francisellaceae bacterium]